MLTVLSVALGCLNVSVMWLLSRQCRWAWLVSLGAQVPWSVYDIWSKQYGFLIMSVAFSWIAIKGYRNGEPSRTEKERG